MHKSPHNLHDSQPGARWLHSAGPYRSEHGVGKPLHTHPVWEAVYYLEGNPGCRLNDDVISVQPGVLVALPPGTPHGELSSDPWACYWVIFDNAELIREPAIAIDDAEGTILHVVSMIVRECRSEQPLRSAMIDALLCQLGVIIQRATTGSTPCPAEVMVEQFERTLQQQFHNPVSIAGLCGDFGVSASYMRQQFRRFRGVSPMERIQQLRVQQAIVSIQQSTLTLDAIAETCGFSSASHLSRQVKRITGKSPGTYRTSMGR